MIPNPQIYTQDLGVISSDLLPVKKRTPTHSAWLKGLLSSCQWLHDLIFTNYAGGSNYTDYSLVTTYNQGDRTIFIDGAVYESLKTNIGILPSGVAASSLNWIKVLDTFIGARERARYNGQKLMLEYLLNRRFEVSPFSLIEWEVIWGGGVPVAQSAPPYTQIYIKSTNNPQSNFWLSNGNGLVSFMSQLNNVGLPQMNYLGNAYTYSAYQYTVYVPTALYNTIAGNQPPGVTSPGDPAPNAAGAAIRYVLNQHAACGSVYQIILY